MDNEIAMLEESAVAADLRTRLEYFVLTQQANAVNSQKAEYDEVVLSRLRALGYVD